MIARLLRLNARIAATRPGAFLLARVLHHVDRFVWRLTGGRRSFAGVVAGVDVVLVTTTGARSGLPRVVPLLAVGDGDQLVVVASNWGQTHPPAWYGNLRRTPAVTVERGGRTTTMAARDATGEERGRLWPRLDAVYPGYRAYRRRAGRTIPIVILSPAPPS